MSDKKGLAVLPVKHRRHPQSAGEPKPVRAAQYVRMSTEHQKYSTENQSDAIREYAEKRNIQIVRTYADEGKSGLRLDGRDALKRLIEDVQTETADFEVILVYDISRWGRFQDADESAFYEYTCKRAGITVQYCAEQFENDGSPFSTMVKGFKRSMAGEYSRELSVKVFAGQCRLIELGYRQGGPSGFGLRRQLVDQAGAPKGVLSRGEHKSIQTDRIVLIPGPPDEIETVRWIYREFAEQGYSEQEIAENLNAKGILSDLGRQWTRSAVHQVLINEKYIGNNVWNRISYKLKKKRVRNQHDMLIRAENAFPAIVDRHLFEAAQSIIVARSHKYTDEEMLERLRQIFDRTGFLSGIVINEAEDLPSSAAYDQKLLRGNRLTKAKRLIEQRRRRGKKIRGEDGTRRRPMSVDAVMKKYREDTQKKRALVRKADLTRGRLIFIVEALRKILADDHFRTLLKAEGLDSLPRNLSGRLHAEFGG